MTALVFKIARRLITLIGPGRGIADGDQHRDRRDWAERYSWSTVSFFSAEKTIDFHFLGKYDML
jgi:hypothetical protein